MGLLHADDTYVEPGAFRLSHEIVLENIMHRVYPGWKATNNLLDKTYSKTGSSNPPWKSEWGQSLLTEAATRLSPDIFGRVLFELQGDYADRFWRPVNYEHHIDNHDRYSFIRQAEANIDKDEWFLHAFKGVGHGDWGAKGDFFGLYPGAIPNDDYLGRSGLYGIYPANFTQDMFLNISRRHAPRGFEGGFQMLGLDVAGAYGNELVYGYGEGGYGRVSAPLGSSKLTFVYKNEDVPYALPPQDDERMYAYALSWRAPLENGNLFEAGVKYQPFRLGEPYQVAREVDAGAGLLGSSTEISNKKTKKEDALAERIRYEHRATWFNREVLWSVDGTHAGVVAGNKDQVDLRVGSYLSPLLRGSVEYTYRRPLEGPIPFIFEGTPENLGAIASNPRGPSDPFTVDWNNREAVFLTTTFVFDPTPGTTLLTANPDTLEFWNVNQKENAAFTMALQYRMSDYRTTTDRLFYYDENGNIVFEPAGHSGAWATDHPLNEFRVMTIGQTQKWSWMLGFAGGESPALSSLAYSEDTSVNKPLTHYYSFEGRIDLWPFSFWGHYGSGVWGPESYQRFFGESFDELFGGGVSYKITVNTTVDISYLGARQNDNLFVAPDLGAYDEFRTLFSHRFGFIFQLDEPARSGYRAR
ncbi:MAG: hypothetical protein KCHDKBKB_02946 [Elusimicrobia bacterium]|nr:hypothetical protein [Elusimicrobiota bacterium]